MSQPQPVDPEKIIARLKRIERRLRELAKAKGAPSK
jgi:hypothetical protein